MKRIIAIVLAAVSGIVLADPMVFPYDTSMTTKIATNGTVVVSDEVVSLTGETVQGTDNVVKLEMNGVTFTAAEAEDWNEFVSGLNGAAMLTIKKTSEGCAWYGYSDGVWTNLTGVAVNLETNYQVQIAFDKTTGANKIGYSVAPTGDPLVELKESGGNYWLPQGNAATQLSAVDLKGTGAIDDADLRSGARTAYANITGTDQTYSFDYSNVVIGVVVGQVGYGANAKLKVTLTDGYGNVKFVEQTITQNATNDVDFAGKGLVAGRIYDCQIQVTAENVPAGSYTGGDPTVSLGTAADWFGFSNGAFVNATTSNVVIVDNKFQAEDEEHPAVVTPTSSACSNSTAVVDIEVDYTNFAVTSQYDNVQSALGLTEHGWMCLANDGWVSITNENVATAGQSYWTRAEFDYTVNPGKVRFSVKQGDTWYVMKHGETAWFALCGSEHVLAGTSFSGGGKVSAIAAAYNSIIPLQPTIDSSKGEIVISGSTDMDLSKVDAGEYTVKSATGKNYNMKWSDKDGKYAKVENGKLNVLSGTPNNGLASYDSFVLGLDPASATSKPVLDSAQNAEAAKLTFKVPNVTPNTNVAEVVMKVLTLDSPSATSGTETLFTNGQAVINLPDGVKYYKVKISIKTK